MSRRSAIFPALGACVALALAAPSACAQQIVVAEAEYTHSAQTTKDSHFRVKPTPETPADWTSPVDYAHGSVHVRLEVKTKPSDTPTRYQICFEMKQNYCCTDQAPVYTTIGKYDWDTEIEKLWRPGPVDFAQGILQSALILKDTNNVKPAPENVGAETAALYMPTDLRVTVTLVAAGDTYQSPDAPQMPTTGGASGSGGASGAASSSAGSAGAGAPPAAGGAGSPAQGGNESAGMPSAGTPPSAGMPTLPASGGSATMLEPPASDHAEQDSGCALVSGPSRRDTSYGWLSLLALTVLRRRAFNGRHDDSPAPHSSRRDHAQRRRSLRGRGRRRAL